ncbi:MAG TPA: hypothetical protein VGI45_21520 [Terracidiphilus sp.]|jgi:hypothetical protein
MIRTTLQSALCLVLSPLLVAQQVAPGLRDGNSSSTQTTKSPETITLPRKTVVALVLLESVSSATAQKGDKVRLAVAKDVSIEGTVVIPKGTPASGLVAHVQKAVPGKRDGDVEIKPASLTLSDGREVSLRQYVDRSGDGCGSPGECTAVAVILILLIPVFIGEGIASLFPHHRPMTGRDQEIEQCQSVWASTIASVRISPAVPDSSQSGIEFACTTRNSGR